MVTRQVNTQLSVDDVSASGLEAVESLQRPPAWSDWLSRAAVKGMLWLTSDLSAIVIAHWVASNAAEAWLRIPPQSLAPASYYLFYLPFFAATFYLFNAYGSHDLRRPEKELELVCKAATFSFLALIAANFVFFRAGFSRYFLLAWYAVSLPLLLATRFTLRAGYIALWRRGRAQQRALLMGAPQEWTEFEEILSLQRHRGYNIIGLLVPAGCHNWDSNLAQKVPVLGRVDEWAEVTSRHPVDLIVVCSALSEQLALEVLPGLRDQNIDIEIFSGLFSAADLQYELDGFSGFFRFRAKPRWVFRVQFWLKQLMDRIIGAVGSLVVLLMMPLIAALIKFEDGGPVFYRSAYLGQDGNVHYYLKFRSMCVNADEVLASSGELRQQFQRKYKLKVDPRVTRVGKFLRKYSLDEFPQFFSVLLGKLSFVGPRTIRHDEGSRYGEFLPKLMTFKPGVTGFWQVMGRQTTTYEERVQMDMFYIDRWSIWLDLVIIAKTVWQILKAEGAY